ncbi:MAG: proline--tRNA ligase [Planctomycetaceae bacterium]|nr:proline--tRNA ligase [Planctomycetaceae bacterium]
MRYSQLLIPTIKEVPAEAEIPSHQLMIRAGFIRKLASGTYTYLPLGLRCLQKIMAIVRQEMNAAGAQEILAPCIQPMELWQKTGRDVDYGETMCRFKDRHGRMNVLAPTAEEVFTDLVSHEVSSYKQLPINLYQISQKFRDEFRPRFGVLRSREFIMKDAYSFNASLESLEESYQSMYRAYCRIFDRCGVPYVVVEAESGEMGGSGSQQFTVPTETGEDVIVHTEDGTYAANIEKAGVDPLAKETAKPQAAMEEVHTPGVGSIEAVCAFLKTQPADMIKTLVYSAGDDVIVALVRGDHELNPEKLTQAMGGRHVEMAEPHVITRLTGAAVGFAGPQGLAGKVARLLIDHAVAAMSSGVTGANKTDYHVKNVAPGRDFPLAGENVAVLDIRNAAAGDTHGGKKLLFARGIEVGQIFKLGTKYSAKLGAKFLDEQGKEQVCLMGCYGIGINRILASAIECAHDDRGSILPINIAPFEVEIIPLSEAGAAADEARRIYDELLAAGVDALMDDRAARPGVKFADADLLGIPLRVVVGERGLKEGNVELKARTAAQPTMVKAAEAVAEVVKLVAELKSPGKS